MLLPLAVAGGVVGAIALLLALGGFGWWGLLFAAVAIVFGVIARGLAARAAATNEGDTTLPVKLSLGSTMLGSASVLLIAAMAIAGTYDIGPMAEGDEVLDEGDVVQNFDSNTLAQQRRDEKKSKSSGPTPGGAGLDTSTLMGE